MGFFGNTSQGTKRLSDTLKYAKDYKTELYTDEKGRARERVIYTGEWTVIRSDEKTAKRCIAMGAVCALLAIVLLFLAVLQNHVTAGSVFVMLPLAAALFPALYVVMALFRLPYRLKPMKRDVYMHGFIRAFRSLTAMGILTAVSGIAGLVVRAVIKDFMFLKGDIVYTVCLLMCLGFTAASFFLLRKPDTSERPNSYCRE